MARYWVYLNDEVAGPFALEQLIRQRGFSRQTLVCMDDASGKPTHWISPAEIPELAHIFKAADEQMLTPSLPVPAKAPSKSIASRPMRPYTPAVALKSPARDMSSTWIWLLVAALLLAAGAYVYTQRARRGAQSSEQDAAKALIENARLPAPSPFSSLRQYLQEKQVNPKWEFERVEDALYHVTLSWYAPTLAVYAFEANVQAQTLRGLNTAAVKLLSEGFPAPPTATPKVIPAAKKSPAESFSPALEGRREAMEKGDFAAVWSTFSKRKKAEMARGGISRDGFLRLQNLTHRLESASIKQQVLKTKQVSESEMLVLQKQIQNDRPDILIKQHWVYEDDAWKLDDEQKKTADDVRSPKSDVQNPKSDSGTSDVGPATQPAGDSSVSHRTPDAVSLPGMSH